MITRPAPPGFANLRIVLEPGYDDGRVGAWAVDLPGAFAWADGEERALTAVLTATGRLREFLEDRGERVDLVPIARLDVVATQPAERRPDGYEVDPLLDPDRAPIAAADLETAIRWLAHAREDLLSLVARVDAHEAARGPLPTDGPREERTSDAVLRHLAGTEAWLISRLDRDARYEGPLGDGPATAALAGSRAWAVERLRALHAADPARDVTDRHGERWTIAKVRRRLLYHAFDHLWELDRRLARADGTAARIEVVLDRRPAAAPTVRLLRSVGWDVRASDGQALEAANAGSTEMATAWLDGRLVGTARSLSDGTMNAYLAMVVVHPAVQGLGVGERMLRTLMDGRDHVRFALSAAPGMDDWYRKLGFEDDPRAMVRRPRRH